MDEIISFSPPSFDFGKIFVTGHPCIRHMTIQNNYTKSISLSFSQLTDSFYIIKASKKQIEQIETGFDIFSIFPKITSILIPPKSSRKISLVCKLPADTWNDTKEINGEICVNCYKIDCCSASASDDENAEFEPCEEEMPWKTFIIKYKVETIEQKLKITPQRVFLDDCCKFHSVTIPFSIKNQTEITMKLASFVPEGVDLVSQTKNVHCFVLDPNEEATFKVNYFPIHTGQHDYKILFTCSNPYIKPFVFLLSASVSPDKLPVDFPTISPSTIAFGNMHTNETQELTCMITNPSKEDYKVTIGSYSDYSVTPLLFKTALKSQQEPTTTIVLNAESSRTIYISYTPKSNYDVKPGAFQKREFVITLVFTMSRTGTNFYKRVPVVSNICHSNISVQPKAVNFGDMQVSKTPKHASIKLTNNSGMSTTVTVVSTSKWIALSSSKVELQPFQTIDYQFSFYPYKISPDFHCSIRFENDHFPMNEERVVISADILASKDEVTHMNYYSIISDQKAIHSLEYQFVSANFPAIKQLTLKNISKDPITLSIHSSSPKLIVYEEVTGDASNKTPLKEGTRMSELEKKMKDNHKFFTNMIPYYGQREKEIYYVSYYNEQLNEYNSLLEHSLINSLDKPISVAAGQGITLWAVLIPESLSDRTLLWTHKRESLSFDLLSAEQKIPPHIIQVKYNVAASCTFITAHNLNYGTLVRKTTKESQIYLMNESTLPLLYQIETNNKNNIVTVLKNQLGIVPPLENRMIPIRVETATEGTVHEVITIKNILNPKEEQHINIKAQVERRAGFFVDPLEIDFGVVPFGSSVTVPIYIKNIREEDASYTFSHFHRESSDCKPMISFQYQNMSESHLTAAVQTQLEKWNRKLLIEERKKRFEKAEKIKVLMEQLKKTSTSGELLQKRSTAKSIDRIQLQSGKLQTHCLHVQLIPSLRTKAKLFNQVKIEGSIEITEDNRVNSSKSIKYRAIIKPQETRTFDDTGDKNISITPEELDLGTVFVQNVITKTIEVTNLSKTNSTPFWVSSETTDDAIFTFGINEGNLGPGESLKIPFDLFTTSVKELTNYIIITTPTSSQRCKIRLESVYDKVLAFPTLSEDKTINFGSITLTSLTNIEERRSFDIENVSDKILFVNISHIEQKHVVLYVHDPHFPIMQFIQIDPSKSVRINLMLRPDLDLAKFKKYSTFSLNDKINVSAFHDKDDAINVSLHPTETSSCVFNIDIPVVALVGRVGLKVSEKNIDFGCVEIKKQVRTLSIKNKSTKIPLDIICTPSQGLSVSDTRFTLPGSKISKETKELEVSYSPTVTGLNTGKLILAALSTPFQLEINVSAFVDPKTIEINLPRNERGFYTFDVGTVYLDDDKPVKKKVSFTVKNITQLSLSLDIPEIRKILHMRQGSSTEVSFNFPHNDSDEYEEGDFSYLLHFKSKLTKSINQIVEIRGSFAVSHASPIPDIDMGTIFSCNGVIDKKLEFTVINSGQADLFLDFVSAEGESFFEVPKTIGPVKFSDNFKVSCRPIDEAFAKCSGRQSTKYIYRNRYNTNNTINVDVTMNILKSFLTTNIGKRLDVNIFKEVAAEDNDTVWTASCFFSVGNALDDETTVAIKVIEDVPDQAHVEILKRNTETTLETLLMQAADIIELRAKITLVGNCSLKDSKETTKLATIVFSNEAYPPFTADVYYSPTTW